MTISEEAIWDAIKEIKVPFTVPVKFSESGITRWLCPLGIAQGYAEFSNRGACGPEITAWPRRHEYAFYEGREAPHIWQEYGHLRLYSQELMIYLQEMKSALNVAVMQLDALRFGPIPRHEGHHKYDNDPYPEDFGNDTEKLTLACMITSIERWLNTTT